ncbi:hypothetical protein BABINDRAFT_159833 [Babjeviella inositovora NRRL Y-12698]|uniref:RING-type E3 ubiquitin transferase n=1 Tax=Babjeviella inositovora NRRL Y-12698 TaxID=984486 RepID=A0A1E3QV62_9ASCO|nr:uncharacterized protein BABINDRAFT_159833 [Babjeviella inositovora NRRL Y-12698]ODQ81559.1 hypothetical protein BABINDRAFT_159833 [Babjeviella inositovora NRRL Y-12698]
MPNENGDPPTAEEKHHLQTYRQEELAARYTLGNSTYASGYGNLTGFRLTYNDVRHHRNISDWPFDTAKEDKPDGEKYHEDEKWSILPNEVSTRARAVWTKFEGDGVYDWESGDKVADKTYLFNLTGSLKGSFTKYNETSLLEVPMPLPEYLVSNLSREPDYIFDPENPQNHRENLGGAGKEDSWRIRQDYRPGNVSDATGEVSFSILNEETPKEIREIAQDATYTTLTFHIQDVDEYHKHDIVASGVYFQETGNMIAVTNSAKFWADYAFPHLAFNKHYFRKAREIMMHRFNSTNARVLDTKSMNANIEAAEKCEYIAYLHFKPANLTAQQLQDIDEEFVRPVGRPVPAMPAMEISQGVLYSPDCGIVLTIDESNLVSGMRKPVRICSIRRLLLAGIVILMGQLYLSIRQMNHTNTPSTMSRLSFWTVGIMNLIDGSLAMLYLLSSAMIEELYLPLVVSAFISFALASIFELRYMILIYMTQVNERSIDIRTALRGRTVDAPVGTATGETETLLPTVNPPVQQQPVTPVMPADETAVTGIVYSRFFFTLIAFSFLILNAFLWRRPIRYSFEFIVVVCLSSYWLPQVYRNIIRGSRRSFAWEFILGSSMLRLLPVYYLTLYKGNPFGHHYAPKLAATVTVWLLVQLGLLYSQEILGARFFLPDSLLPKAYEYHPILCMSDLENHSLIGEMTVASDGESAVCDCAVCMSEVVVPIKSDRNPDVGNIARTKYMVTPCRHVFHTDCLEGWMKYKLQCPVCRNGLPPL